MNGQEFAADMTDDEDRFILRKAAALLSEDGENAEYDRGVIELTLALNGGTWHIPSILRGIHLGRMSIHPERR